MRNVWGYQDRESGRRWIESYKITTRKVWDLVCRSTDLLLSVLLLIVLGIAGGVVAGLLAIGA